MRDGRRLIAKARQIQCDEQGVGLEVDEGCTESVSYREGSQRGARSLRDRPQHVRLFVAFNLESDANPAFCVGEPAMDTQIYSRSVCVRIISTSRLVSGRKNRLKRRILFCRELV